MPTTPSRSALPRYRRQPRGRRGAATVELAVVAPLFLILILGTIEMARVMMVGQIVTSASRAACRQGTLTGVDTATLTQTANATLGAGGVRNATVTVQVNDVTADASSAAAGDKLSVQVQAPLVSNSWLPTPLFIKGGTASATTVMRHE